MASILPKIRLRNLGHAHYRFFEIVVIAKLKRNRSSFLDYLGYFNPHIKEKALWINLQKFGLWLNKGSTYNLNFIRHVNKFVF